MVIYMTDHKDGGTEAFAGGGVGIMNKKWC